MTNQPDIDNLHIQLGRFAAQYRSSLPESPEHFEALHNYYIVFQQLVEHCGKIVALDPYAELPDELMPKEYVDFWLR
jgi:hypothetical protein